MANIVKVTAYPGIPGTTSVLPSGVQGDILEHNGTAYVSFNAGTAGQVLRTGGAGADPTWANNISLGFVTCGSCSP